MAEERAAFLMTECNQEVFSFATHFSRRIEASFTAGQVSSDGGALLLLQADRKINLLSRMAVAVAGHPQAHRDAQPAHLWAGAGLLSSFRQLNY